MRKYGMFNGRFQPFHNGHFKTCLEILKKHDKIIIAISNPTRSYPPKLKSGTPEEVRKSILEARKPENNRWSYWERHQMIRNSLTEAGVDPERIMIVPRLSPYDETSFDWDSLLPKRDEITAYINIKDRHHEIQKKLYSEQGWDVKELSGVNFEVSGTKVRENIDKNIPWKGMVPEATANIIEKKL